MMTFLTYYYLFIIFYLLFSSSFFFFSLHSNNILFILSSSRLLASSTLDGRHWKTGPARVANLLSRTGRNLTVESTALTLAHNVTRRIDPKDKFGCSKAEKEDVQNEKEDISLCKEETVGTGGQGSDTLLPMA